MINLDQERDYFLRDNPQYAEFNDSSQTTLMSDDGITAFIHHLGAKGILQLQDPVMPTLDLEKMTPEEKLQMEEAYKNSALEGAKIINDSHEAQ